MTEDLGFDGDSISWTFLGIKLKTTTYVFDKEHDLIGDRLVEILNAVKRKNIHSRPHTHLTEKYSIRMLARAIAAYAPNSNSIAHWRRHSSNIVVPGDHRSGRTMATL